MPFFRIVAAKNNQKVELTAKFDTELIAKESLHKDGYSIIEIRETEAPIETDDWFFYFEIQHQWQKKSGKIQSNDIFKAYKKLVDELGYNLISIASTADASEEEKAYTTAKARESYDEFKRRYVQTVEEVKIKKEESKKSSETEWESQGGVLEKEVKKYQGIISMVYEKLELFLNTYADKLNEERVLKIKELLPTIRQMRQGSNIDKLRIIGEAALIKLGELEIELLEQDKSIEKSKFLKETNSLLKDLWSNRRVGNDFDSAKKIIGEFIKDFQSKAEEKEKKPKKIIDTWSFTYYKNLRELSLYKDRLKEINKEILRAFFQKKEKKNRLILKRRLLKQNIKIIESRISQKTFSYTKLAKGAWYYEDVFVFLIKSINDIVLYSLAITILFLCIYSLLNNSISDQLLRIVFLGSIFSSFIVIFNGIRSFIGISFGFIIFFLVTLALQINF